MKLTLNAVIDSVDADISYLLDPLFEFWSANYYKTYAYFIVLAVMIQQAVTQ